MGAVAGIAAQFVAPMVSNIAGGLLQNITGGGGMLGKLPGIGDAFQKISGGMQQMFGGAGSVMGGIGQLGSMMAPRGMLPDLPGIFKGPHHFQPFGPKHPHFGADMFNKIQQQLGALGQQGSQIMNGFEQMMGKMQGIMDGLNKLLGQSGSGQSPLGPLQGGPPFLEQLGNLLKQLGVGAQPGAAAAAAGGASSSSGGDAAVGGSEASGGTGSSSGVSEDGGGLGDKALSGAFDKMDSLEGELEGLDMNSKDAPKKMMQIQQKMQKIQQMIQTINEMRKAMHDMSMGVIRNIR